MQLEGVAGMTELTMGLDKKQADNVKEDEIQG